MTKQHQVSWSTATSTGKANMRKSCPSDDVDWEGDSPKDENNSFCSPGVKMEKVLVHIKNNSLEGSASSENTVCDDSSDSLSDDSLVI